MLFLGRSGNRSWSSDSKLSIFPWNHDFYHLTQTEKNPHNSNLESSKLQLISQPAFFPLWGYLSLFCLERHFNMAHFLFYTCITLKLLFPNFSSEVSLTARESDRTQDCIPGNAIPSQTFLLNRMVYLKTSGMSANGTNDDR